LIEGHTDAKGAEDYNQSRSERRAQPVKDWFVTNADIGAERIVTRGWGESRPVAPNEKTDGSDDPEGRQKNRRVDITVKTGFLPSPYSAGILLSKVGRAAWNRHRKGLCSRHQPGRQQQSRITKQAQDPLQFHDPAG
jgi:hypothetical protein